ELKPGELIGYIDTVQLYLKKKQLMTQIKSTLSQRPNVGKQIDVLNAQLASAEREKTRVQNLVNAGAVASKQLDDVNAQIDVIKKQITAQKSSLQITNQSIGQQTSPIIVQIAQIDDQIAKSLIINPIKGIVLAKYVEPFEIANAGKPLYKIADLNTLQLRAYITASQFGKIKLGQEVTVTADLGKEAPKKYTGKLIWISNQAEFTPKTIQTAEERANLVYAVKVQVPNDGLLKLGMYGEVHF
ncbi:MAG: HlyD family efflux transporter periplasmic adaptor subunit, partial [Saprospiraceae bacterium]